MRLNIEWVAPWLPGKPYSKWAWHKWNSKGNQGVRVLGLNVMYSSGAIWNGLQISINW